MYKFQSHRFLIYLVLVCIECSYGCTYVRREYPKKNNEEVKQITFYLYII